MTTRRYEINVSGGIGGGGPTGPGMGGPPSMPAVQNIQSPNLNLMASHLRDIAQGQKGMGGVLGKTLKTSGIQFSVAGILKQSQLFTGMIGSVFQILGAGVDIILAAFMPILIPAIRGIAYALPILRTIVDNSLGVLVRQIVRIGEWIYGEALGNKIEETTNWILEKLGIETETSKEIAKKTGAMGSRTIQIGAGIAGILALWKGGKVLKTAFAGISWGTRLLTRMTGLNSFFTGTKFGTNIAKAFSGSKLGVGIGKVLGIGGGKAAAAGAPGMMAKMGSKLKGIPGLGRIAGMGKLGAKGLLPGIGSAIIAGETLWDTVKNYKEARENGMSIMKSMGLAGATAGAGLTAAGVSFVAPAAGLALQEAGKMGTNAMMNKWGGTDRSLLEGTLTGGVINLTTMFNGQTVEQAEIKAGEDRRNLTIFPEMTSPNPNSQQVPTD